MSGGYYRFPTIHRDRVVFVSEDDLWTVPADGGIARRLTTGLGRSAHPEFSPNGEWLAFTGRDEGHPEVYVMPAEGGPARRLTYLGAETRIVGWEPDGQAVVFTSVAGQPFLRMNKLWRVPLSGGAPEELPTGPAVTISYGPDGGRIIGRHTTDLARWKRYRGGLTGELWIDRQGNGAWSRLVELDGNLSTPLWVGDRIVFVSDHEGVGNLFSCDLQGQELKRHTAHRRYYVRHPSTDGQKVVYHAGADLYVTDLESDSRLLEIEYHSGRTERQRRFVDPSRYLQSVDLHPKGKGLAITTRGKAFSLPNWDGPVVQHGESQGVRYRLATWLHGGRRIVMTSDASGEEVLEVHSATGLEPPKAIEGLDIGRPTSLQASPTRDQVVLTNHRHEVILVDLETQKSVVLDHSPYARIRGLAWSPDGRWVAYGFFNTRQSALIRLANVETGDTHDITDPVLLDVAPAFDPDGKYLYFLSYRYLDPVSDSLHFEYGFPRGMKPCLVTLQADAPNPFDPTWEAWDSDDDEDNEEEKPEATGGEGGDAGDEDEQAAADPASGAAAPEADRDEDAEAADGKDAGAADEPPVLKIDLDGIAARIVEFPVSDGRYGQVRGIEGKVLFTAYPIRGTSDRGSRFTPRADGTLKSYDFKSHKTQDLMRNVTSFDVSRDRKWTLVRSGNRLRVLKSGTKANDKKPAGKESGWVSLGRVKVSVEPAEEWQQMYREAWRLQRDQFWTQDMAGVDWDQVYRRYLPLLDRVGTRSELSDFLWEVQGELGTSHAYEFGGDYRPEPGYYQGLLGADLEFDPDSGGYRVTRVLRGDPWDDSASSPLIRAGAGADVGDILIAVDGRRLSRDLSPGELLVHRAGDRVQLTFLAGPGDDDIESEEPDAATESAEPSDRSTRTITVKTLRSEREAAYRDWVNANRRYVHDRSDGQAGYIHIPDMGPNGYAEFHRGFLTELDHPGLVVDVRYNGGGHVSQLLLEKLARRRIGYDITRWGEPQPYPNESVMGPMVALTNEAAGSDGDMFSHAFKLMGLGPLLGKRTWGGVVGISMRDSLVDGSVTTQPEFSFWFEDVGYGLENYGAVPDEEIEITPQDYVAGRDTQLEAAVDRVLDLIDASPPRLPDFGERPSRALPEWGE